MSSSMCQCMIRVGLAAPRATRPTVRTSRPSALRSASTSAARPTLHLRQLSSTSRALVDDEPKSAGGRRAESKIETALAGLVQSLPPADKSAVREPRRRGAGPRVLRAGKGKQQEVGGAGREEGEQPLDGLEIARIKLTYNNWRAEATKRWHALGPDELRGSNRIGFMAATLVDPVEQGAREKIPFTDEVYVPMHAVMNLWRHRLKEHGEAGDAAIQWLRFYFTPSTLFRADSPLRGGELLFPVRSNVNAFAFFPNVPRTNPPTTAIPDLMLTSKQLAGLYRIMLKAGLDADVLVAAWDGNWEFEASKLQKLGLVKSFHFPNAHLGEQYKLSRRGAVTAKLMKENLKRTYSPLTKESIEPFVVKLVAPEFGVVTSTNHPPPKRFRVAPSDESEAGTAGGAPGGDEAQLDGTQKKTDGPLES